jgi:hypothetical protein
MRIWTLLVPCAALVAGCGPEFDMGAMHAMIVKAQAMQKQQGAVDGQIVAGRNGGREWRLAPVACRSGQPEGFFGVDLASATPDRGDIRVLRDPIDGPRVRIQRETPSGPETMVLDRSLCSTLDVTIDREGIAFGRVDLLRGSLLLDCQVGGANIAGTLRFEDCHRSELVNGVQAELDPGHGSAPGSTVHVPDRAPTAVLPPELRGLSVRLEPHIVGVVVGGDTRGHALAMCKKGDAELVREMGWTVAADATLPDMVARFGCTRHVEFSTQGRHVEILVPHDGTPSLELVAAERIVATVPAGATRFSCDSGAGDPEADCGRRASAMAGARIAAVLAKSGELKAFAEEHARRP